MEHLYFLRTLDWKASGTYYDEKGQSYALTGEVSIERSENKWTLGGYLEVLFAQPIRFTNDYNISQTENDTTLSWESYNPALGKLRGTFEFIGDSIISCYQSENGVYSGTETLTLREDESYYNVGVSFCNGRRMSSWTAVICHKNKF